MRVTEQLTEQQRGDLAIARGLARMGVPIILLVRRNAKGELLPSRNWQHSKAEDSEAAIAAWRPGYGLGALCGVATDVLDVDPRNGGRETWATLKESGRLPAVYAVAGTASGGMHHWIARTGLSKRSRAGIDLLAGNPDGKGRSFCFIPPTERTSKETGQAVKYEWITEPDLGGIALTHEAGFENAYADGLARWFEEGRPSKPARRVRAETVEETPYGRQVWANEVARLHSAVEGERNNTLNRVAFAIAQVWSGGMLGAKDQTVEAQLQARLAGVAEWVGLDPAETRATIESGWSDGVGQPRDNTTYELAEADAWPGPKLPLAVARKWLAEQVDGQGRSTLRYWRNGWWRFDPGVACWHEIEPLEVAGDLFARLESVRWVNPKDGLPMAWNPTPTAVRDVASAAMAVSRLSQDVDQPCWLGPALGRPAEFIPFRNGLLRMSDRVLLPTTPDLFVASARPFDWSDSAPTPRVWLEFLDSVWTNDPDAIALLQEWFGYVLSGRMDAQKMMVLLGPPRSGKGTIARVATQLVGDQHTTAASLHGAGQQFGMQGWIGKSLVIFPDVRTAWGDTTPTLERLLSITGGDQQAVHRKGIADWVGVLGARVMIMSNDPPKFSDASGAITDRMLMLQLQRSFLGREDLTLAVRLEAELPGIMRWALDGLDRLVGRGLRFTVPKSSAAIQQLMRESVSAVMAFIEEELDLTDSDERTSTDLMWAAWQAWHLERGDGKGRIGNSSAMGRDLKSALPWLAKGEFTDTLGERRQCYRGVRLRILGTGQGVAPRSGSQHVAGAQCSTQGCLDAPLSPTQRCWAHRVSVTPDPLRNRRLGR